MNLVERAIRFATIAHANQKRKYTGEPYVNHPIAVSRTLESFGESDHNVLAAAVLHDVIEDTEANVFDIADFFNQRVAVLVFSLTDKSIGIEADRATRKKIDRESIADAPREAKDIKLCDLIDNIESIVKHDKSFAKIYLEEKRLLLEVLENGSNPAIFKTAMAVYMGAVDKLETLDET